LGAYISGAPADTLTKMRAVEIRTAESLAHEIGELVAERQDLRARGASTLELEASRRRLAAAHHELARLLAAEHLRAA
jgi:hypothetical protein